MPRPVSRVVGIFLMLQLGIRLEEAVYDVPLLFSKRCCSMTQRAVSISFHDSPLAGQRPLGAFDDTYVILSRMFVRGECSDYR